MELDQLILLNKHIKRRLEVKSNIGICGFIDAKRRPIKASPVELPSAILVSNVEIPYLDIGCEKTPYSVNHYIEKTLIQGYLSREEVMFVLGINADSPSEVHGMLRATEGLPGSSNAYVLGYEVPFQELKKPDDGRFEIIPVQYYLISEKAHASLALTKDKIKEFGENLGIAA